MLISVIIPTFNRANYLKQTIDSALEQDFSDFEILVVDNASTDGTPELMREYAQQPRVRYVRNKQNIGMVGSWRRAVFELAHGDWFLILSDDDYLIKPSYLRDAAELISTDAELKLVYADGYVRYEETGEMVPLNLPFSGVTPGEAVFKNRGQVKPQDFTLCNVLFRRDLAIQLDSFSDTNNLSCDTELFLLSCLHGKVGAIKGPATVYRIHASNLLKTARANPRLCFGALGSLVNPYIFARQLGLHECAESMRKSSGLNREIIIAMLKVACLDFAFFQQAKASLSERAPNLAREVMQTVTFRTAVLLCRLFPWLYSAYVTIKNIRMRFR